MQCILCKSDEINDLELGEMKVYENIHVHYFCMLLSSSLLTNGDEDDGILGFLPADIIKESRRAGRLKCHYCHQMNAGIGCCIAKCNRSFHLNCGLKNNCVNQFTEQFLSFCDYHVETSKEKHSPDQLCIICYMKMGKYEKTKSIFSTCCKSEWFHKMCLMRLADSAGYFFKCPKCNDKDTFTEHCMKNGIFIPQRDASWETEENAFQELMERPSECIAVNCICPDGRNIDKPSNELLICETCGSNCMHKKCWGRNEPYYCCSPTNLTAIKNEVSDDGNDQTTIKHITPSRVLTPKLKLANYNMDSNQNSINSRSCQNKSAQKTDKERKRKLARKSNVDNDSTDVQESNAKRRRIYKSIGNELKTETEQEMSNISTKWSDFPIKRIRNGNFNELRYKPVVLLTVLSAEQLKLLSRNNDNVKVNASVTSRSKLSFEFAIISPTKKNVGKTTGKTFKNYTITSFFKPI